MGSSVRKTSAKIKKLLKETIELNPTTNYNEVIPKVAEQTLRSKKTKSYFGDKDFVALAGGGLACFRKVKAIGFENFIQEYEINKEKVTVIEAEKIIESILNKIEDDNGEIESQIILSAFQNAMTKMLLKELAEPVEFLAYFCEIFIAMVIREEASEVIITAFNNASAETLNKSISEFSDEYVKNNFLSLINQCCEGEMNIEELIQKMQDKLD